MASCSLGCTIEELGEQLNDTGEKLLTPPSSTDELLLLLDKAEKLLSKVGQDPSQSIRDSLLPIMTALISNSLQKHTDIRVKISVVSCISEISKVTAPDAPYGDSHMKDIFKLVVVAFEKLSESSGHCYSKAVNILVNCARVRFCIVLLDLECEAILIQIFQTFFDTIRADHSHSIYKSMEAIMTSLLQESDEISPELLYPILESLRIKNQNASPIALELAETVLRNCSAKVKPYLRQAMKLMSLKFDDFSRIVASVCENSLDTGSEDFEMGSFGPVNVSENGFSKTVVENESTSNNMTNEKVKKDDVQRYILNGIGDVQPDNDASKGASVEPTSNNTASKTKEPSFEQKSNKSSIETPGTEVPASLHTIDLVDSDDNFSENRAKKRNKKKTTPQTKEMPKRRRARKGLGEELVDKRIKVWWPLDQRFYEGTVSSFDPLEKKHTIWYTDGEEEILKLNKERWELCDDALSEQNGDVRSPRVSSSKSSKRQVKEEDLMDYTPTRSED